MPAKLYAESTVFADDARFNWFFCKDFGLTDNADDDSGGKLSEREYMQMSGRDRRSLPRLQDRVYQICVGLNILAWVSLAAALVMFHFARPEMITGLQAHFGIEVREYWSEHHVEMLNYLLQSCLVMTLVSIALNQRRSRREDDHFGMNLIVLGAIVVVSLLTLQITIG